MDNPLLTDKEMKDIRRAKVMPAVTFGDVERGVRFFMEDAAKAEAKKLVEWLKEYGFAVSDNKGKPIGFSLPWEKWEELEKEVAGEVDNDG